MSKKHFRILCLPNIKKFEHNISMNAKTLFLTFVFALSASALVSCGTDSSESGGSDKRTYTYTVNFYDDSAIPKQIGYAYVSEGEKAVIHKMDGGTAYDYTSNSDVDPKYGTRDVFDCFKGTYDETKLNKRGETVTGEIDLNNILNDCDVYATFKNEPLTYKVAFKVGTSAYDKETYEGKTFTWGAFADLPATDPTTDEEWGYDTSFKGYTFNDAGTDLITKSNISSAKFLHGEGTPVSSTLYDEDGNTATATTGSYYEDTTNMDFYAYSGTWTKIGNFKTTTSPKVTYLSKFNKTLKQFTVNFYSDSAKTILVGSAELDYASEVKFDNTAMTITGKKNGVDVSISFASFVTTAPNYWDGVYSSDESVPEKYRGQSITNHATSGQSIPIAAPIDFWPVF